MNNLGLPIFLWLREKPQSFAESEALLFLNCSSVAEAHEDCRKVEDQADQHAPAPNETYPVLCRSE